MKKLAADLTFLAALTPTPVIKGEVADQHGPVYPGDVHWVFSPSPDGRGDGVRGR